MSFNANALQPVQVLEQGDGATPARDAMPGETQRPARDAEAVVAGDKATGVDAVIPA